MSSAIIPVARSRRSTADVVAAVHDAGSNHSPTAPNPAVAAASTVPGGSASSTVPAAKDTIRSLPIGHSPSSAASA